MGKAAKCRQPVIFTTCVQTQWGDSVKVVGSSADLGSWDPHGALELTTDAHRYPAWQAQWILTAKGDRCAGWFSSNPPAKLGSVVDFKLVIVRASGEVEWEPIPQNRRLDLSSIGGGWELAVSCKWGEVECRTQLMHQKRPVLRPIATTSTGATGDGFEGELKLLEGKSDPASRTSSRQSSSSASPVYSQSMPSNIQKKLVAIQLPENMFDARGVLAPMAM